MFNFWDGAKNRTCRYLLQRYLGKFLDEKLDMEQVNIQLFNGKATIQNVPLRVEALNELLEAQGCPLEFTGGYIGSLTLSVPWSTLLTSDSSIEASDVMLCLRPVKRVNDGASMIESMWSSVSSSLQLVEEYMKQEEDCSEKEVQSSAIGGLEKFAETIDNVLNRIKARFTNITINIEYPSLCSLKGVALNIQLDEVVYRNETGNDQVTTPSTVESNCQSDNMNRIPTYAKHNITINGVNIFTQDNYVSEINNQPPPSNTNCADIPILQIAGPQNIQIKVKRSEDITGPKICFDIELGEVYALFSPCQIQLLIMFLNALSANESTEQREQDNRTPDYTEVFESDELYKFDNIEPHTMGVYGNLNMWSGTDDNTNYNKHATSYANIHQTPTAYRDSLTSSISSSTVTSASKYQRKSTNLDSCGEISNFEIKVAGFMGIFLHENILVESNSNKNQELLKVSTAFFENVTKISFDKKIDVNNMVCEKNHVLLHVYPIIADGKQNRNKNIIQMNCTVSATNVELCEILEGKISHLVCFNRTDLTDGYYVRPEMSINISSTNTIQQRKNSNTYIDISLKENIVEFDISIIDRLGALFGSSPHTFVSRNDDFKNRKVVAASNKTELTINCDLLDINLRFPIVDLRPLHDPSRVPWWKQNITQDYLLLRFNHFKLNWSEKRVTVYSSEIDVFYTENGEIINHLIKISTKSTKEALCEYPQIIVDFTQCKGGDISYGTGSFKLPFSSKRNCRENANAESKQDSEFIEDILLPGETSEINEFCAQTLSNSMLQIQLNFPLVDIFLESKQLYEVIYNRLITNLFMWETSCPYLKKSTVESKVCQSFMNMGLMDSVYISTTSQNDPFDSACGQIPQDNCNIYQAFCNKNERINVYDTDDSDNDEIRTQEGSDAKFLKMYHNCSVELKVGQATGSFFVPVRDNDKHILPEVFGKFIINLTNFNFFIVNGFGGNNSLSYITVQMQDFELFHCGIVPMNIPLIFDHCEKVEDFMQSTLYKVPCGLTKGIHLNCDAQDMLSLVIEITKIPLQRVKRLKITTGIRNTTIRYHPSSSTLFWLHQLLDFIDIEDYPVEGYKPFSVISEMQLHLWDCAIDFRPSDFPYRAVIELCYFSVCSNIIPSMPSSNVRFVLEEWVFSIAPHEKAANKYPCSEISVVNSKDLVPILDIGYIDISLRFNEEMCEKFPIFDLRCSIHDVHFRTCYDSASAFAQLIGHIAQNSNDANKHQDSKENSLQSSESSESDLFVSQTQPSEEITNKQQERVSMLIAEALQETREVPKTLKSEDHKPLHNEHKSFYFPDENNQTNKNDALNEREISNYLVDRASTSRSNLVDHSLGQFSDTLALIKAELGEVNDETTRAPFQEHHHSSSNEEDFCIVNVMEKFDFDEIRVIDEPIFIVDNHFSVPSCSNDLLSTPSYCPMPERRYTLCKMTLTWHLYGGNDFSDSTSLPADPIKDKSPMSDTYRQGVSYSNNSSGMQQKNKPTDKITWKSAGGPNRNHEVLVEMQFTKVQFSYEIYPQNTIYASRQVLVVNDIEIRDRLQCSQINKFLYNENKKSFRDKRSQKMVVVKALHVRPNPHQSNAQECSLRMSLSPLRLNIDQHTWEFLADYFTSFGKACDSENSTESVIGECKQTISQDPIMTINDENEIPEAVHDLRARRIVKENISILFDEKENDSKTSKDNLKPSNEISSSPIYFREIIFDPDVSIRFDYIGRRIELSNGTIPGLLMGLAQLQFSEIKLRKITNRRGMLGFAKVYKYLCNEWLRDIKKYQLPTILGGLGPTHSIVKFFEGIYDLFRLPIVHYQKDGRIIRGLQLGAQSFSARTILAALEITSRLIHVLQFTAETAYDMVSPGPSIRQIKQNKKGTKKRHYRPRDIREGVANAYQILKEGINDSANNLIETAAAEHDQKGLTGAVGAVMRQVPQLVVCPAVLATQATTNILGGVQNSLVPEAKFEAREKWKDENC